MSLNDDLPTLSAIESQILAIYQSIRPNASAVKYSDLWLNSKIWSRLLFRVHRTFARGVDALFPNTTFGTYLDEWLALFGLADGLGDYGRIQLRGSGPTDDALTVTATGVTVDLDGYQLTATNGTIYEIDESHAFAGAGTYDYQIVAVSKGSATNLETGDVLTFSSPPANVQTTATLVKDMAPLGADQETDTEGRARLKGRWQRPVLPGNVANWVDVIESAQPGALKAYVWPGRENQPYGFGTTDYCARLLGEHGADRMIIAADDVYTLISDAVEDNLPGLMMYNSRELVQAASYGDIEITIELGDGATDDQKVDWDAESVKVLVDAADVSELEVTADSNVCAPTVTNGIEVGHRVVIRGHVATVNAVNIGADAAIFTVSDWPAAWGAVDDVIVNDRICAGGGFVGSAADEDRDIVSSGIMGALIDYTDAIGPCIGGYGAASQIPGWDDTWRQTAIKSLAAVVGDGNIIEVTINDIAGGGAADKTPTDTATGTVNILCLLEPVVWQTWV